MYILYIHVCTALTCNAYFLTVNWQIYISELICIEVSLKNAFCSSMSIFLQRNQALFKLFFLKKASIVSTCLNLHVYSYIYYLIALFYGLFANSLFSNLYNLVGCNDVTLVLLEHSMHANETKNRKRSRETSSTCMDQSSSELDGVASFQQVHSPDSDNEVHSTKFKSKRRNTD